MEKSPEIKTGTKPAETAPRRQPSDKVVDGVGSLATKNATEK
jgi:hypothetical protein